MADVSFSLVQEHELPMAYGWHRGFAAGNHFLLPKPAPKYRAIVESGHLWVAKDEQGDIQAMSYAVLDGDHWELGGLMVAVQEFGRGLGSTIFRITLGHLLFEEDPLSSDKKIITHVHAQNKKPLNIIQGLLQFQKTDDVEIPKHLVPGLLADDDGFVRGSEFGLVKSAPLTALAEWCRNWTGQLNDGSKAHIDLRDGVTMDMWADAFLSM